MAYFQCINQGGGTGNVADVEVNGESVLNPTTKIAEITSYKEVTQAEYNALPDEKLSNGIAYFIKDSVNGADGFPPLIYSLEERQVGVWADGKPLYQKSYALSNTVNISNNTNLTTYMADITSTLERFIFAFGCGTDGKSTSPFFIQFYNSQITAWATPAFDTNIITVQYTKTTDVAGSGDWTPSGALAVHYSTNEQVVGTWIDGKPLYEKTIILRQNGVDQFTYSGYLYQTCLPSNIEFIDITQMYMPRSGGDTGYVDVRNNSTEVVVVPNIANRNIYLRDTHNPTDIVLTIQYTKTTD